MQILIDNGHGHNTPGKQSPDGSIREYAYTRQIARRLRDALEQEGIAAILLTPEENDVSLGARTLRANRHTRQHSARAADTLLVSIHLNAHGNGDQWRTASGFSVWIAPNASHRSRLAAQLLTQAATAAHLMGNRAIPAEQYWTGNFAIVRDPICPAILTENLFMTNPDDCELLKSEQGKQAITDLHLTAIKQYIALQQPQK